MRKKKTILLISLFFEILMLCSSQIYVLSSWELLPDWREKLDLTTDESLGIATETAMLEEVLALNLWLKKRSPALNSLKDMGISLKNPINHLPLKEGTGVGEFQLKREGDFYYALWTLRPRKGDKILLAVRLDTAKFLNKIDDAKRIFHKYHLFFGSDEAKGEITFAIVCAVLKSLQLHHLKVKSKKHLFTVFPPLKNMRNVYDRSQPFWKNQPGSATLSFEKPKNGEVKVTVKYNYPYTLPDGEFGYTEAYFYFDGTWKEARRLSFIP